MRSRSTRLMSVLRPGTGTKKVKFFTAPCRGATRSTAIGFVCSSRFVKTKPDAVVPGWTGLRNWTSSKNSSICRLADGAKSVCRAYAASRAEKYSGSMPAERSQYGTSSSFLTSIHTGWIPLRPRSVPKSARLSFALSAATVTETPPSRWTTARSASGIRPTRPWRYAPRAVRSRSRTDSNSTRRRRPRRQPSSASTSTSTTARTTRASRRTMGHRRHDSRSGRSTGRLVVDGVAHSGSTLTAIDLRFRAAVRGDGTHAARTAPMGARLTAYPDGLIGRAWAVREGDPGPKIPGTCARADGRKRCGVTRAPARASGLVIVKFVPQVCVPLSAPPPKSPGDTRSLPGTIFAKA